MDDLQHSTGRSRGCFDAVIVGNSLSALLAAIGFARRGQRVALVNPTTSWGGHFGGITIHDQTFDLGMVVFEFDAFVEEVGEDIRTYDPRQRYDAARFRGRVARLVREFVDVNDVPDVTLWFDGAFSRDLYLSNELDRLARLPPSLQRQMEQELGDIVNGANPCHASRKLTDPELFRAIDYERVSLANHGRLFHELFIEPMIRKSLFISSRNVPALFHRIAWLPLYYPETLSSQFGASPQRLSPTRFHYPKQGCFRALVDALEARARTSAGLTVVHQPVQAIRHQGDHLVCFGDGTVATGKRVAWSGDPRQLLAVLGADAGDEDYDRVTLALGFVLVETARVQRAFSSVFVADPTIPAYRLTNQTMAAGRHDPLSKLVVELNADYADSLGLRSDEQLAGSIRALLLQLGVIGEPGDIASLMVKRIRRTLVLPTFENYRRSAAWQTVLDRDYPHVDRMGSASGFGSWLVNDHIVQALKLIAQDGGDAQAGHAQETMSLGQAWSW